MCWLAPEQTAGKQKPYMYTQGQAVLNRSFFPCFDTPSVKCTYSASVQVSGAPGARGAGPTRRGPRPGPGARWRPCSLRCLPSRQGSEDWLAAPPVFLRDSSLGEPQQTPAVPPRLLPSHRHRPRVRVPAVVPLKALLMPKRQLGRLTAQPLCSPRAAALV